MLTRSLIVCGLDHARIRLLAVCPLITPLSTFVVANITTATITIAVVIAAANTTAVATAVGIVVIT